jgi:hypothetical protein
MSWYLVVPCLPTPCTCRCLYGHHPHLHISQSVEG